MAGSPNLVYTIEYQFAPAQVVWVIRTCNGISAVEKATVVRVIGTVLTSGTTVTHEVQLESQDAGVTRVAEDNIFGTLAEAMAEYETRVA